MSAFPFGGHPTLNAYVAWAVTQGCEVQSTEAHSTDGLAVTVTRLIKDDKWVVIAAGKNERLSPATVDRFDRRLGIMSPFASLPSGNA